MIKAFNKVVFKVTYLNIIKAIGDKPTANIILIEGKPGSFSLTVRNKTGMSSLPTFTQQVLATAARQ